MADNKERERFEEWAKEHGYWIDHADDPREYRSLTTEWTWRAWQAAIADLPEKAKQ